MTIWSCLLGVMHFDPLFQPIITHFSLSISILKQNYIIYPQISGCTKVHGSYFLQMLSYHPQNSAVGWALILFTSQYLRKKQKPFLEDSRTRCFVQYWKQFPCPTTEECLINCKGTCAALKNEVCSCSSTGDSTLFP